MQRDQETESERIERQAKRRRSIATSEAATAEKPQTEERQRNEKVAAAAAAVQQRRRQREQFELLQRGDQRERDAYRKHLYRMRQMGLLPGAWQSRPTWRRVANLQQDYELLSVLGSGASGIVLLANDLTEPDKPTVVLKLYGDSNDGEDVPQTKWFAEQARAAEIETLVALYRASGEQGHPNVVPYLDAFVWAPQQSDDDDSDPIPALLQQAAADAVLDEDPVHKFEPNREYTVLVLDYIPQGIELFDYFVQVWEEQGDRAQPHPSPQQLRVFLHDGLAALSFMHTLGFAHRDVKPENLYVWQDAQSNFLRLMLLDMGFACHSLLENDRTKHHLSCKTRPNSGTITYISPEFARAMRPGADPLEIEQRMASDIWALAATIALVASGTHPIDAVSADGSTRDIVQELINYTGPKEVIYARDVGLNRLLQKMLDADWRRRPTAVEAMQMLNSLPFPSAVGDLQTSR